MGILNIYLEVKILDFINRSLYHILQIMVCLIWYSVAGEFVPWLPVYLRWGRAAVKWCRAARRSSSCAGAARVAPPAAHSLARPSALAASCTATNGAQRGRTDTHGSFLTLLEEKQSIKDLSNWKNRISNKN